MVNLKEKPMTLEGHMRFASRINNSGVSLDLYMTEDDHLVEAMVCTGEDYENRTYVAITTQIGCPIGCSFCKVSEQPLVRNLTSSEYLQQVSGAVENINGLPWFDPKRPMKVSFGRAGEPLLNKNTIEGIEKIAKDYSPNFQIFSVMPSSPTTTKILDYLLKFGTEYDKPIQLSVSMHNSDEEKRKSIMPHGHLMSFKEISEFGKEWSEKVNKRKINLAFLLIENNELDIKKIRDTFDPEYFIIRIAYYLPSSIETAKRHAASSDSRMGEVAKEVRAYGYTCIEARAGPVERIWDLRPYSGFKMLRYKDQLLTLR